MTPLLIAITLAAVWFFCGWLAWGLNFAFFQRKYPMLAERHYHEDLASALVCFLFGIPGLLGTLAFVLEHGVYGFKWLAHEPERTDGQK